MTSLELKEYSLSESFFEPKPIGFRPEYIGVSSIRGRFMCLSALGKKLLKLPFALVLKLSKTFFRVLGLGLGIGMFVGTLGISKRTRNFFHSQAYKMAKDLIDWILWPFGVITCFARMLLGSIFHPGLYFNS